MRWEAEDKRGGDAGEEEEEELKGKWKGKRTIIGSVGVCRRQIERLICWLWWYWGVEKGQQAVAEAPFLLHHLHLHLLSLIPTPSYLCQGPAGTTVYLGGNIVTSGVV